MTSSTSAQLETVFPSIGNNNAWFDYQSSCLHNNYITHIILFHYNN